MFNGLSGTYSLVNVAADQIKMLLKAGVSVKVLVSESCPDSERKGIYASKDIEWVKIVNTIDGKIIRWYDYSQAKGKVHESFYKEVDIIAEDFVKHLKDVDVCIMHDILYQGWHLVHNLAIRKAQKQLPNVRFLELPILCPQSGLRKWTIRFPQGIRIWKEQNLYTQPIRDWRRWQSSMISL